MRWLLALCLLVPSLTVAAEQKKTAKAEKPPEVTAKSAEKPVEMAANKPPVQPVATTIPLPTIALPPAEAQRVAGILAEFRQILTDIQILTLRRDMIALRYENAVKDGKLALRLGPEYLWDEQRGEFKLAQAPRQPGK